MKKLISLFSLFAFICWSVAAQTVTITGKVTSGDDGLPIPGVSVLVKGTTVGTITNMDGDYSLSVPQTATTLVFSFVGMKTEEIAIESRSTIDVAMVVDYLGFDEVIVTAFGSAKKAAFTGSAAQINYDQIELRPVTNISTAIEGSAAGVQVTATDGQPGSSQAIRVRGFGSYSASNAPLYVVDGAPYSGSLSAINPNDIESLTILKDAASTALYGNKAANGVVLITTKKGRTGKGQLSLNLSHGFMSRAQQEYELLDAYQYYPIMWESYRNGQAIPGVDPPADVTLANQAATDGIFNELGYNPFNVANNAIVGTDGKINPSAQFKGTYGEDLDWLGALMRTGHRQNYDMAYQGGTEKTDYFISLGYLDEKGWIIESDFKRVSGRANVNYQATKWFKTGFNVSGANSKSNMAQTGSSTTFVNPVRFTRQMGPIYPIHAHDPVTGEYILDDNGDKVYDLADNRTSNSSTGRHVIAEIRWDEDLDEITSLGAKTFGEIQFFEDLKFTTNVSFDQRHFYNTHFNNKYVGDGAPGGRAYRTYTRGTSVNFNQLLNYNRSFGNHNIIALVGHESYEYKYNRLWGARTEIIADGNTELGNFVTITGLDSYTDSYTTEGYLGRLDYDFNNKYFFTASYRRDGSSKFAPDSRWGDFWSLGVAWRLDQESFIQSLGWINMLKLRGSYGQVGNDAGIGYYAYQALYALGYNNQSESGFVQDKLMAPGLVWESNNSFDLALEFGLFTRLYGTLEFYHRISENLLFEVPLPLSSGLDFQEQNIGAMFNQGIEFSLSADVVQMDNFRWNINTNFSTLKNEFTKLPQEEIIDGSKKLMVGHSIYDYWLKEWYGVDPDDGSALYRADVYSDTDPNIRIMGSDTLTIDQNNAKYHYAGTAIPSLLGAITNTISYKGFELGFMFTYQIGGKVIDYNYQSVMSCGHYGASKSLDILDRWQQPGDKTDVPRMDATQTANFNATSDRWLTDASFLNLRQLTLSYKLRNSWIAPLGMSSARVYLGGENLFLINARKGMNVQQEFSGTTSNVYTPSRVFTIGINVTFL